MSGTRSTDADPIHSAAPPGTPPVVKPRLLVSVRSSVEALAALEGGAEILDVKEPSRGPLGMADVATVRDVLGTARIVALAAEADEIDGAAAIPTVPVSAALGELRDWKDLAAVPALPPLTFAKLGLAGMLRERDWIARWNGVRRRFDRLAERPCRWIAVAYADWKAADAPEPSAVISAAAEAGCAGLLFDTFDKSAGRLFDHLPPDELRRTVADVRRRHQSLLVAVGGGLAIGDLPHLAEIAPDVVAIRTAACARGERGGTVTSNAVARFRAEL
ncbi:MAG: (5-formylfuran-3-yl)methyl phosphate synthase [Planctomycetales bacterium]